MSGRFQMSVTVFVTHGGANDNNNMSWIKLNSILTDSWGRVKTGGQIRYRTTVSEGIPGLLQF